MKNLTSLTTAADDVSLKALTVASDTQAGYLAPAEVSKEFIRDLVEISPIRQFASVRSTSAPSAKYPKRTGITNAKWEGEIEEAEESPSPSVRPRSFRDGSRPSWTSAIRF